MIKFEQNYRRNLSLQARYTASIISCRLDALFLSRVDEQGSSSERNKVERNPASLVKLGEEKDCRVRWLTDDEEERLLKVMPADYHPSVVIVGLRTSEQLNLKWADIDFQRQLITIRESKAGEARRIATHG